MNINDITKQIRAFADQLETQSLEEPQLDPYAELKKAHAEGKVIEFWNDFSQKWESNSAPMAWCYPTERYRIKPEEPTFQLPPPPPGMQWHREDDWKEGDLPQGWRPLVLGEQDQIGDQWGGSGKVRNWYDVQKHEGATVLGHFNHRRTRRPLTFTHAGKQWTWHRPGDPMPCAANARIECVFADYGLWKNGDLCGKTVRWSKDNDYGDIIGWRYADEKKTVPLGLEDVPPGSVLSLKPPRWFIISGVNDNGLYVLDDEPLVENLWRWDYLMEKAQINRSIPLTGKWNPDAWEPCHKEIDA